MTSLRIFVLSAAVALPVSATSADVVFSNFDLMLGAKGNSAVCSTVSSANEVGNASQWGATYAQSVTIDTASEVRAVRFMSSFSVFDVYTNLFRSSFYSTVEDAEARTPFATFDFASNQAISDGRFGDYGNIWRLNLPSALLLDAGDWLVELAAIPMEGPYPCFWSGTLSGLTGRLITSQNPTYRPSGFDHMLELLSVPTPGTAASLALLGVAALRRRR